MDQVITRRELKLHCRTRTRGEETTDQLITEVLQEYTRPTATDLYGAPLLDDSRVWGIWEDQRRHIGCIQDPPEVQLFTVTGQSLKGGVQLQKYRCARGSVSVESFHCHLKNFIPGMVSLLFYLLEGCWYKTVIL